MSSTHMRYDDAKARRELGYQSRPASEALADAARFFLEAGYLSERRRALLAAGPLGAGAA